jgi:hypothetical protein
MSEGRKHLMTYSCAVRVHRDNAQAVEEAVAERPTKSMELQDWDDVDPWVSFFVLYGPVRGANRHDVKKFFQRFPFPATLSEKGETEYECCGNISEPCTMEITWVVGKRDWFCHPRGIRR